MKTHETGTFMEMNNKKPLIILTGPTAVGKTALSISLAQRINGEMISADSMQVYRGMDVGTAKITREEMCGIKHYLIDVLDPKEAFNVTMFKRMALAAMEEIYEKNKIPIVVGGTGFYIQALLYDVEFSEQEEDTSYRDGLIALGEEKGALYLHQMLAEIDPQSAIDIHPNNTKRVIRAIEYFHQTGERISAHNARERGRVSPYNFAYFVLNDDREKLYQRIEKRIDIMLKSGLIEEVEQLRKAGCHRGMVSMEGLGYKEILDYLDGECTLEDAIYILKRDTRHFAKRQLTWFKRERDVIWLDRTRYGNDEAILEVMNTVLHTKNII